MKTSLFAGFSKVEEQDDGTVKVYGVASSESRDHDGEKILATAVKAALPDYLVFGNVREMHQPIAAGTAIEASVDDQGITHLGAHIIDPSSVKKVRTGVLKGFSIGGKVTKRNAKDKSIIEGIRLTEISLVDRPSNPDALITLAKFDSAGRVKKAAPSAASETDDDLKKSLWDVGELARLVICLSGIQNNAVYEAANENDGSLMPTRLKAACQVLVDCLRDMVDEETRELLGGMLDVAAMKKAVDDGALAKAADVRSIVSEVIDSLGLKKAATLGEPMNDTEKAAADKLVDDKIAKAVTDAVTPLKTSVDTLTKSVGDLTTENTDLKAKLAKSEGETAEAKKLAQDLADAAVAKGIVKAVAKTADTPAAPAAKAADELAKSKPTDVAAEMKATFAKPLSPIRGLR